MWFNEFKKILFVKIAPPWSHCPPSRMHSHWGIQKYEQNSSWHYKKYVLGQVFWYTVAVVRAVYGRLVGEAAVLAAVWFHKKRGNSWKKRTRYFMNSLFYLFVYKASRAQWLLFLVVKNIWGVFWFVSTSGIFCWFVALFHVC